MEHEIENLLRILVKGEEAYKTSAKGGKNVIEPTDENVLGILNDAIDGHSFAYMWDFYGIREKEISCIISEENRKLFDYSKVYPKRFSQEFSNMTKLVDYAEGFIAIRDKLEDIREKLNDIEEDEAYCLDCSKTIDLSCVDDGPDHTIISKNVCTPQGDETSVVAEFIDWLLNFEWT
ncbi:hypothetical protein AKJ51_04170, partial [candidate division MSBL1 archaeon SCGC-AAA382A20]